MSRLRAKIGFCSVSIHFWVYFFYGMNTSKRGFLYFRGPWPDAMLYEIEGILKSLGVVKSSLRPSKKDPWGYNSIELGVNQRVDMTSDTGMLLLDFLESKGYRIIRTIGTHNTDGSSTTEEQRVTLRMPTLPVQVQQQQEMKVVVPAGIVPGGQFLIKAPSGQQMTVTAPPGTNAGDTIVVNVPNNAEPSAPRAPEE